MKVRDSLYRFPGYTGTSVAHLRVYDHEGSIVAVVGEVTDNPSTSVTNRADVIVDQLRREYGNDVIVIEHYPPDEQFPTVVWSSVTTGHPRQPHWQHLSTQDVEVLVGEPIQTWRPEEYTTAVLLDSGTAPAEPELERPQPQQPNHHRRVQDNPPEPDLEPDPEPERGVEPDWGIEM